MTRIIVLTGDRGVGKTTVCSRTATLARGSGYTCGGILTVSRAGDVRDLLDVRSKETRRLTLERGKEPAVIQGRFRFNPETLEWGNSVLARAVPCELLVVDEIGPLEMQRERGLAGALGVLRGTDFALALVVVRPELLLQAQRRLPSSATTVLAVTVENRDRLPTVLLHMLKRETGDARSAE